MKRARDAAAERDRWLAANRADSEPTRYYTVSFACTPSVFDKVMLFIKGHETKDRSYRAYDLPDLKGGGRCRG